MSVLDSTLYLRLMNSYSLEHACEIASGYSPFSWFAINSSLVAYHNSVTRLAYTSCPGLGSSNDAGRSLAAPPNSITLISFDHSCRKIAAIPRPTPVASNPNHLGLIPRSKHARITHLAI